MTDPQGTSRMPVDDVPGTSLCFFRTTDNRTPTWMIRVGAASPEEEIFRPQAPAGGRKIVWGGEYLLAA